MLLLRLIRFIFGYVRFRAVDGFPERFINLCARQGIILWDLQRKEGVLQANTSLQHYQKIRPVAKKSGMHVRASEKHGLPFFLRRHRRRIGLVLGAMCFVGALIFLSTRIWTVQVSGNQQMTQAEVLAIFSDLGVYSGARRSQIDIDQVENQAIQQLPNLNWVTLNIHGSSAQIEIRESNEPPPVKNDPPAMDIVAAHDGLLLTLETYSGTAAKQTGDGILAGDVLIYGAVQNLDGSVRPQQAAGYAVARSKHHITATQPLDAEYLQAVQTKNHYTLLFFGLEIPLGPRPDTTQGGGWHQQERWLELRAISMPLGIRRQSHTEYVPKEYHFTETQASLLALEDFNHTYRIELQNTQVEIAAVHPKLTDTAYTIQGEYTVLENIGVPQESKGLPEFPTTEE